MIQCHCRVCDQDFVRLRRRGSLDVCSRCSGNARVLAWKRANPERAKQHRGHGGSDEAKKRYASTDRGMQVSREKAVRHYRAHKLEPVFRERVRAGSRKNYARHKGAFMLRATNRKKHVKRATPSWADMRAIASVYEQARKMTVDTGIKYTVDHIVPLRAVNVSGLHVPYNLQVMTLSQNCSKKNVLMDGRT